MEKIIELLVNSGILGILILAPTQFLKKKYNPTKEQIRLFFYILCIIIGIVYYFLEKNDDLLKSVLKIFSYSSGLYYVVKGLLDYNEENKIL